MSIKHLMEQIIALSNQAIQWDDDNRRYVAKLESENKELQSKLQLLRTQRIEDTNPIVPN